jgi:hypothetical protein
MYISKSQNERKLFFREIERENVYVLVLGQMYETVTDNELVFRCHNYLTGKTQSFEDPAGHYIIFVRDKISGSTHVFTNRFGTYHSYWATGKTRGIGTFYMGMVKDLDEKILDWDALSGFFGTGYFPADKTYLTNIRIFKPASCYSFDRQMNLVAQRSYWKWQYHVSNISTVDRFEQLHETLKKSLGHALKERNAALPISGGLDSRMLAGVISSINAIGTSLWGYSYGYDKQSAEIKIARQIAGRLNVQFQEHVVPDYLFDKIDVIADSVDLFQYVDGTRQACMEEILNRNADIVVGGHWGDVWMDNMDVPEANDGLHNAYQKKILKKGSGWLLSEVCADHLAKPEQYVKGHFDMAMEDLKHIDDQEMKFRAYKTNNWSFRWTLASIRMYQAGAFPVLPFYDRYVADAILSVPATMHSGRKFQINFIKHFYPQLAEVTWQEYGRNLYSYKYFNNRSIAFRAFKKLNRTVRGIKPITRNWELFYLHPEGRAKLEQALLFPAFNEIVPERKIRELVGGFYKNPSGANGYTVSMLHTFAQFIKRMTHAQS